MTTSTALARQPLTLVLFLLNLLTAFLWAAVVPLFGRWDFGIGLIVGLIVLSLYDRHYGPRLFRVVGFIFHVLWQILLSNFALAWMIVQPAKRLNAWMNPGIVEVPLRLKDDFEVTVLATVITLTPGTLTVDLGRNDQDQRTLYIHSLRVEDPEKFRSSVVDGFEERILQITKSNDIQNDDAQGAAT